MRLIIYDIEVFVKNWIVVMKEFDAPYEAVFHNDAEALRQAMDKDAVYIGFNTKRYDKYILQAILGDWDNASIKELNDFIIGGGDPWSVAIPRYKFNNADLMDDMQIGQSLKSIEGHLGLNIKESDVSFDIDRALTPDELEESIEYCKADVLATEEIVRIRKNYLQSKMDIGRMAGLSDAEALSMTNAKLTAAMLRAKWRRHDDERCYEYPDNLKREYIPLELIEFFDCMYNDDILDDELFKSKLNISIGECPITIGYGGIHGAIPNYIWKE